MLRSCVVFCVLEAFWVYKAYKALAAGGRRIYMPCPFSVLVLRAPAASYSKTP